MDKIVKYANEMNKVSFRQLTASEYDTLFAIVSQIKDQGARELTLSFDQIKSLIRWDKSQREELFVKTLINMYDKIINLKFNRTSDDGNIISRFVVFSRYSINKEKQTALIAVSADFWQLFNLLFDNFTTFMLDDLVYISTSYGKELFRNIKQFRTQGYLYWSIEIFRQKLMVPDSFSTGKAFQR
ncbi:TPA: replication initiation protein, partial [Streptococcus agalactiae]